MPVDPSQQPLSPFAGQLRDRPIVLVGLMGAGKTAVGRRLAVRLGLGFVDSDAEIEASAGKSITEIFADHGEAAFRDGERRVIARLLLAPPQVIATGGGAFMDAGTRAAIADAAISIWLRAGLDLLMERVGRRHSRPLLRTGDPRATMARLLAEREPVYSQANITIESRHVPHDVIVEEVIAALCDYRASR